MDVENAVEVSNVKKQFFMPHHHNDSLKRAVTQIFKNKERGGDSFHALNGVSFDVKKGDFFGILGRNGSGKSTLLKIISEIYQPTSGQVRHEGRLVSFIELGVGFKPELSGYENVYLNGALLGFSKSEIDDMYDDIVAFAELEKFMDQKVKNYSSGMKVRLAFSVAIRARADVLILDEVLAVGDAAFQRKCNNYFNTLKEDKKTVILVTHSMSAVREFCNKAVVIDGGKVLFEGNADEAADTYLALFENSKLDTAGAIKKRSEKLDKKVTIESIAPQYASEQLEVGVELKSKERQKDIKLAIRIRDINGKVVAGVNTQSVINPVIIDLEANRPLVVKFTMPNVLGNGRFSIDARVGPVVATDTIHDKYEDETIFANSRNDAQYPVLLPASVEIERR